MRSCCLFPIMNTSPLLLPGPCSPASTRETGAEGSCTHSLPAAGKEEDDVGGKLSGAGSGLGVNLDAVCGVRLKAWRYLPARPSAHCSLPWVSPITSGEPSARAGQAHQPQLCTMGRIPTKLYKPHLTGPRAERTHGYPPIPACRLHLRRRTHHTHHS